MDPSMNEKQQNYRNYIRKYVHLERERGEYITRDRIRRIKQISYRIAETQFFRNF